MKKKYKKWVSLTLLMSVLILIFFGSINYYIDPLWNFSHSSRFNSSQENFNERQQKTNFITFREFNYDALLLGSSRTTYINQNSIKGTDAFNFSVSGMSIQEYNTFLEYAKERNGREFDYVFIGLDFFATNKNRDVEGLEIYIKNANKFMYKYKSLLSIDLFKQSRINAESSYAKEKHFKRSYDRKNIATAKVVSGDIAKSEIEKTVKDYKENVYGPGYEYNKDIKELFTELVENNPDSTFVVYTTPVTSQLFNALYQENRLEDYNRWIYEAVDAFGSVYNFMYINSVTSNTLNYYDGHHFYPEVGTLIAHKITGHENPKIPEDFGVLVTNENLVEHLNYVESTLKSRP